MFLSLFVVEKVAKHHVGEHHPFASEPDNPSSDSNQTLLQMWLHSLAAVGEVAFTKPLAESFEIHPLGSAQTRHHPFIVELRKRFVLLLVGNTLLQHLINI